MAIEIERKFLVKREKILPLLSHGTFFEQGYIATEEFTTVRIRIAGEKAFLTIKGKTEGMSRAEFEYPVPLSDAQEMLNRFCCRTIKKTRYLIPHGRHTFEVDLFEGDNEGLIVAEVELSSETEEVKLPEWIAEEVTHDKRYYNSELINNPISNW